MPAKLDWDLTSERELWAAICAPNGLTEPNSKPYTHPNALYWFLRIAWGAEWYLRDTGETWWIDDEIHIPYLQWLQKQILEWKASRLAGNTERFMIAVIIPRRFGKTVSTTKAATLWTHLDEPNMSTMIGSDTQPLAEKLLKPIRETLEPKQNPYSWFSWLYGNWYNADRDWSRDKIVHAYRKASLSEPSVGAFGVETGITGTHPMQIWWDDPLVQTKIKSNGSAYVASAVDAFDASTYALSTSGLLAMILTRYLDDDVAGTFLKKEGIKSWDGMPSPDDRLKVTPTGKWRVYYLQARKADGSPTLACVWSQEELDRRERTNPMYYAAQLMNDPGTGEHMPLTKEQIDVLYVDKLNTAPPIEYATIHLDTAFKDNTKIKKGDFNVIATWLHDLRPNGIVYFDHAVVDSELRSEQFLSALVNECLALRRRGIRLRAITDDAETGGHRGLWKKSVEQALEGAGLRCPEFIQLNRQSTKKIDRIKAASVYWVEGNVRLLAPFKDGKPVVEAVPGLNQLVQEMLRIGVASHDDVSDASADVFLDTIWRKPQMGSGKDRNEGEIPMSPGDAILKSFGKRLTDEEAIKLYDEQNPSLVPEYLQTTELNF